MESHQRSGFQLFVNSRERILAAINHQWVDRVPIDFGGTRQSGISVWAYARLRKHLGLDTHRPPRGLDWIHANTSWKVMLHSDGALAPLLPSIIEMGIDILNPVQTSAAGMEPHQLKREFGAQLVFWGGSCDAQSTFAHGTPEQVAAETEANLEAFI